MSGTPGGDYHVSDADLAAYAADELDDTTAWSVEAHLDRCGRCRPRVVPAGVAAAIVEAARIPAGSLPGQGAVRTATHRRRFRLLAGAGPGRGSPGCSPSGQRCCWRSSHRRGSALSWIPGSCC